MDIREMINDLGDARRVVVGENHDDPQHHRAQWLISRALDESGAKVAVGLQMFRADAQPALDRWTAGELDEPSFLDVYADNWSPVPWPLYRPIFSCARPETLPRVGLNDPRTIVSQVARQGFGTLDEAQKQQLGIVTCDVAKKYQDLIARVMGDTDREDVTFKRFCQMQVVWDTEMAQHALRYLEGHPRTTMVILAGSFHAWKQGVAEQVQRRSGPPVRVILPSSDESVLNYNVMTEDADYVWWVEE